jgi:hypothetical protein
MALRLKPGWHPALRVALAANGMRDRSDETSRLLRAYLDSDPTVNVTKICGFYPFRLDAHRQRLIAGLRRAGLPE